VVERSRREPRREAWHLQQRRPSSRVVAEELLRC
jgi:hypothetical protein